MCWRTPLSWKESFEQGHSTGAQSPGRVRGGGYNALPEGSLCRIRPGQPGSSANLTPTKRGSALRRRSRQDSSQRVIKFQVSLPERAGRSLPKPDKSSARNGQRLLRR